MLRWLCYGSIILVWLLPPAPAAAVTRTWPGVGACGSVVLLQPCINGAGDGDRIEIATNAPITESVTIDKSLTLTAADGFAPSFASGQFLDIYSSTIAGDMQVSVSGLRFVDGNVFADYHGVGTATYDLRDLTLTRASSDTANRIEVTAYNGVVNATVSNNRVTGMPASGSGLINLLSQGGTLNADASYNHVTSTASTTGVGAGIYADTSDDGMALVGHAHLNLHGNEIRGGFTGGGILISEGAQSSLNTNTVTAAVYNNVSVCHDASSAATGGDGIVAAMTNGTIDVSIVNNTVSRCDVGIVGSQFPGGSAGARITAAVSNNLVVAYYGLAILPPTASSSLDNDYNLINAPTNLAALGPHTNGSPALLVADTQPRLRAGSPAIDSADAGALLALALAGAPGLNLDADGLRRFKGASGKADIGAYEFGDTLLTHVATAATISGNTSTIDSAALNGNPGAALIAVPNYNIGNEAAGVGYDNSFGVYYTAAHWALFNQVAATPMPLGAHFDVFVPAAGSGSFVHNATALNSGGSGTTLQNGSTDDRPDQIVLATQNWTAGGSGHYNAFPIGVFYSGDSRWHVVNLSAAYMDLPLGFNIYAQEASPNALRVTATTGNLEAYGMRLDHPLLDGTPCARPLVTRLLGAGAVSGNFDIAYALGKWYVYGYSGINPGDQFHVLVDPAQVFDCTDLIFANPFD